MEISSLCGNSEMAGEGGEGKEGVACNELAKTYSTSPKKRRREFD